MLTPILLVGCLVAAQPATDKDLKVEVRQLVRQLNADTAKERADAKDRLIKLGPAVLDYLPSPGSGLNEGVDVALESIRQRLQETLAAKSVDASTVTLEGRFKISKVLAEIQKQTGNKIADLPRSADSPIPDPEIAVKFEKTPFWSALDSVLDQAQLSIYPYGQPGTLQILPRGPNGRPRSGRATVVGPLRIEPVSVMAKRELRSSSPPLLQISLEAAWEPRLQPISVKQRMADLSVLDSNGGSIAAENREAAPEAFPRAGSSATELEIALAMPSQPPKEITSLEGSLRLMLLGKVETFRFTDLLKGKHEKRIAAATVALDEVRKNGDSWEVFVRLRFDDAGDGLESFRNWVAQNEAYLEDANGKAILPDSTEQTLRTKKEVGMGYVFALTEFPKNVAFVYKTPGMVVTRDFAYKLQDVKMPWSAAGVTTDK